MIGLTIGLNFLSGGGVAVSGGGITVPDDPADPGGGGDTGGGDTGGGDPGTGPTLATLPMTAASRWHPDFSTVTYDGERVATATDLTGLAGVSSGPGEGPREMTDGLGRKFWRFDGDTFLTVADTLTLSSRDMAVFMVGRFHRIGVTCDVFSLGSAAAGTASNANGSALLARRSNQGMPLLQGFSKPSTTTYPSPETMVAGSQMQVIGMVGRADADGGTTLWINDARLGTQQPLNRPGVAGAEIGRYAYAPGNAGNWGTFDLYEVVVCDYRLTDPEGDSVSAALMSHYGIVPITDQLVLDGDSIMQGTGDVTPALSAGMVITDPGAPQIGPSWRVVNLAASGSRMTNLLSRRNAALSWPDLQIVGGQNVLAFEIGRNDMAPSFGTTPTQLRDAVVGYLTDAFGATNNSVLDRGWDVRMLANIASSIDYEGVIGSYRSLIRDPSFASAIGGQAGQISVVDTDLITVGGDTVFADAADAADVTYYAGDSTHPNIAGAAARATGGDDTSRGIAAGLE